MFKFLKFVFYWVSAGALFWCGVEMVWPLFNH